MTATATLQFSGLATGDSTLVAASAEVSANDSQAIDTAAVDATLTAMATDDDDALALTELDSFTYVDSDDGSGVAVSTTTYAVAVGDTADATSSTTTFALETNGADIAFGMSSSLASGDEVQEVDALTLLSGDITASGGADVDTQLFSTVISVGVAVDTP